MAKRIVFITAFFCTVTSFLYAQQQSQDAVGSVKGRITDTASLSLNGATVILIDAKDTTKVHRALSNGKGAFMFSGIAPGLYDLRISYLGFQPADNYVGITSHDLNINTGDIQLHQAYNENATVIVSATIPTSLKNDTIAFSADNFGAKPNATVEDLLKKLPGVQVSNDGVITAEGEQVTRVFVDGKRFFGSDPKLAIENLPKDIVEKIEVFDGKDDQSELTGFDDGTRIKTINIVTKPSRKYGWFGRSSLAMGNDTAALKDPLYNIKARVFHFDGDMKFGMTGMLNNVNNGQAQTANANIFFGDSLKLLSKKAKTDFSGNYNINNAHTNLIQNSIRQSFYKDTALNTNSISTDTSRSLAQSHTINLNFDTKFDSLNEFRIRPVISFNRSDSRSLSTTEIDSLPGGIAIPKNSTYADRTNHNSSTNVNVSATYWHGFKKKGRAITLDMQYANGVNNNDGNNFSRMSFFGNAPDSIINQHNETDGNNNSLSSTLTYTEPVGKYQMMKVQYNNSFSQYNSDRKTSDFDSATNGYNTPNIGLTNDFKNNFTSNRAEVGYMYNHDKLNFNISGGIQFGKKEGNNVTKGYTATDNYTNFYPTAGLVYNFSRTQKLIFRYDGRTNQPAIAQLQPVVDSSNVLYITSGNPDLKQNFTNHFQLMYNKIANGGGRSLFVFLDATLVNNDIVNSITHLDNGGQFTMPVNMDGDYNLHGSLDFNVPLPLPKSNFDFKTDVQNRRSASLVDSSANFTYNTNLSESIHWSTAMDKLFDIDFAFTPAYNITSYSVDDDNNSNYYSQSTSFNGTWYTGSGWELTSGFDYTFYKGDAPGQNISIPLWSAAIVKRIFKDKSGEISLAVHDILNENKGVSFVRNENYSQQTTSNILKRYALLSFTYNLHKFGVKRNSSELKSWKKKYENED